MSRSHLQVPFTPTQWAKFESIVNNKDAPATRDDLNELMKLLVTAKGSSITPDDLVGADTQGPRWNPSATEPPDYKTFIIDKINSLIDKNQVTSLGGAAKRPARKTYRGKTSRRKTSRGKTSRRKTYRRKTNRKKTSRRKQTS